MMLKTRLQIDMSRNELRFRVMPRMFKNRQNNNSNSFICFPVCIKRYIVN